jgi:NADH:ubiquinone oxidoreductase subunit E
MIDQATDKCQKDLEKIYARYEGLHRELIPIFQDIQTVFGYLPPETLSETAAFLNIPEATVYGVVTFYSQYYLTPQGKNKVKVCQGTACHVRGANDIMRAIEKKLGIKAGASTEDFEFNLESVACFGSCALAPVMVVNDKVYGNVTPEQALEILDSISS